VYKRSCLLFEHLLRYAFFLGPYIRMSVISAARHAVNTHFRKCIE
jgi:hypothetical protein